jgi:hypothetical protein
LRNINTISKLIIFLKYIGKAGQDMDLILANRLQARKSEQCTLQPVVAGKHTNIPVMFNSMYGQLVIA